MILVRHPEVVTPRTIVGQSDMALSERGLAQIDGIVASLPRNSRVITSDLARCVAIAKHFGEYEIDARWREQSFGHWEGFTWDEVPDHDGAHDYLNNWTTATPPNGESILDVRARVAAALHDLDEESIVITHAGPIRCALALTRGLSIEQAFAIPVGYGAVINLTRQRRRA